VATSAKAEGGGALSGRRVLVVEDEYFLADDLAQALRKLGAEILGPVPTRDSALALLSSEASVDVAVLDINLKGQAVFPVADALIARGVPFVFATGYDQSAVPEAYRDVPRWEKPFDPRRLAKLLPWLVGARDEPHP
jgi:CheY-like chemotaxis protein